MGSKFITLLRSRLFRLGVLVVSLALVVSTSRTIYQLWRRRDIIGERQEALRRLEEENRELEQKLTEVESPEYTERIARDKLGLVKEGETVVLIPRTQNPELNDQAKIEENLPNWWRWWRLFF